MGLLFASLWKYKHKGSNTKNEKKKYCIVPRPKGTYVVVIEPDDTMLSCMEQYIK